MLVDEKLLHAEALKSLFFQIYFFFLHRYDRKTSFEKWAVSKHPVNQQPPELMGDLNHTE